MLNTVIANSATPPRLTGAGWGFASRAWQLAITVTITLYTPIMTAVMVRFESTIRRMKRRLFLIPVFVGLAMFACATEVPSSPVTVTANAPTLAPDESGEQATVTRVIDGDTIEVRMNGVGYRVRYVGINTPERDEVCYAEARDANAAMVEGQTVTMVRDQSNTDRYGRLLRYLYVGERFINAELVTGGYAEAVEYVPDTRHTAYFRELEGLARGAGLGCHPTGIFDDGSLTR